MSDRYSEMCLAYVRSYYHVPAHIGTVVDFEWPAGQVRTGRIVGGVDAHILVDFDDGNGPDRMHPTWQVTYRVEAGADT